MEVICVWLGWLEMRWLHEHSADRKCLGRNKCCGRSPSWFAWRWCMASFCFLKIANWGEWHAELLKRDDGPADQGGAFQWRLHGVLSSRTGNACREFPWVQNRERLGPLVQSAESVLKMWCGHRRHYSNMLYSCALESSRGLYEANCNENSVWVRLELRCCKIVWPRKIYNNTFGWEVWRLLLSLNINILCA